MLCREKSLTATGISGGAAIPVKCRAWTCDYCKPWRRSQLIAQGISGQPNRFITITCKLGEYGTPERAAVEVAKAWRTIVQRWRRLRPRNKCEYLCVFEAQQNGWPHLHILWRGAWLDWGWLKTQATILLNSPHVHIRYVDNKKRGAYYAAKYCGKENHKFGTAKRYWQTPGYQIRNGTDAPRDFPKCWQWEVTDQTIPEIEQEWLRHHRIVTPLSRDAIAWGHWYHDEYVNERLHPKIFQKRKRWNWKRFQQQSADPDKTHRELETEDTDAPPF